MKVFDVDTSIYHGGGKAWAAVKDDQITGLIYMNRFAFNPDDHVPAWVVAVYNAYSPIVARNPLPISPRDLGRIKKAAIAAGHPAQGVRGGQIKASDIADKAAVILNQLQEEQFTHYRTASREELGKLGTVVSGVCSCGEFIVPTR